MLGDGSQFTLFDGNSNNSSKVGTFYCNLNNTVSNTNWNNGTAQSYLRWSNNKKHGIILTPW